VTGSSSALDQKPDARDTAAGTPAAASTPSTPAAETAAAQQPLPTNRDAELKKLRDKQAKKQAKLDKKKKKSEDVAPPQQQPASSQGAQTPAGTPNPVSQPPATNPTNPTGKP